MSHPHDSCESHNHHDGPYGSNEKVVVSDDDRNVALEIRQELLLTMLLLRLLFGR